MRSEEIHSSFHSYGQLNSYWHVLGARQKTHSSAPGTHLLLEGDEMCAGNLQGSRVTPHSSLTGEWAVTSSAFYRWNRRALTQRDRRDLIAKPLFILRERKLKDTGWPAQGDFVSYGQTKTRTQLFWFPASDFNNMLTVFLMKSPCFFGIGVKWMVPTLDFPACLGLVFIALTVVTRG